MDHFFLIHLLIIAILKSVRWCLTKVLICISLVISDVERLFMDLLYAFYGSCNTSFWMLAASIFLSQGHCQMLICGLSQAHRFRYQWECALGAKHRMEAGGVLAKHSEYLGCQLGVHGQGIPMAHWQASQWSAMRLIGFMITLYIPGLALLDSTYNGSGCCFPSHSLPVPRPQSCSSELSTLDGER